MKNILLLSILIGSTAQAALLNALNCSISGPQLVNKAQVSQKLVSSRTASTLSLDLGEDDGSGTYMTYAKVDLYYRPQSRQALQIAVRPTFSQLEKLSSPTPLSAAFELKSRLGRANLKLTVSCQTVQKNYLLVPHYNQFPDEYLDFQNPATTLDIFAQDLKSQIALHPQSNSESEFLAEHYCVDGDAQQFKSDFLKADTLITGFWRSAAISNSQLKGQNIALSESNLSWLQPVQKATCTKTSRKMQWDEDQQRDVEVTVCDEYRVDDLTPLSFQIDFCH